MNAKNCAKIAINQKYIREEYSVRYKLNIDDMTRQKGKDEAQARLTKNGT